jgi:ATP-dependent exoDNAse (exonuclease V) alpha subunit
MKIMPTKHLSTRVPWHDRIWDGSICENVIDNSFCRILPNIDEHKTPDKEVVFSSRPISELDTKFWPPCMSERGTFLSKHEYVREIVHAYKQNGNKLFKDFLPGTYHHKPFTFNAVPFLWMMKDKESHSSDKAEIYDLDYDIKKEASVDIGFQTGWVQHPENQNALLEGFFDCLKPKGSLVFFYSKHTPLSDPNERIIVGVARIRFIDDLLGFRYPTGYTGHRSYIWDRCIGHTLTDELQDGFLMPYHEVLSYQRATGEELKLSEYTVIAPDYHQFSYASELVEHDTAIESLLQMAAALKQSAKIIDKDFTKELKWIDDRVAEIWDMRGAFPGMGPVLAAMKFENANSIAWQIDKHLVQRDGDLLHTNPWDEFESEILNKGSVLSDIGKKLFTPTNKRLWQLTPTKKKSFYKLLSRCQLNNEQAEFILNEGENRIGSIDEMTENLYLLYENTRFQYNGFNFQQVDKAILPIEKVRTAMPVPEPSALLDNLDERRVRALLIKTLENVAVTGHSLLPEQELLEQIQAMQMDPPCPLNSDILEVYGDSEFIQSEVMTIPKTKENIHSFYKLKRLSDVKKTIIKRLSLDKLKEPSYHIVQDWNDLVLKGLKMKVAPIDQKDMKAFREKAEALRTLCNFRFSVLIGPAGSGKTTLLNILQEIPEIKQGGVIKLAPTGKARVKLGPDAKTLAQFLIPHRYESDTGVYKMNQDAPKTSGAQTIIVDEASMLTEEQLAALFDALGIVQRIILVGDYRQLPPIGTGRPFVDIVSQLKPNLFDDPELRIAPAYAELLQIYRQNSIGDNKIEGEIDAREDRADVQLSRIFGDQLEKEDFNYVKTLLSDENCLEGGKNAPLRLIKWYDSIDLRQQLKQVLRDTLDFREGKEELDFNLSIGGTEFGSYLYFNRDKAENMLEDWQILSPVNGYGYGVKEINKYLQTTYRKKFIDLAYNVKEDGKYMGYPRKVAKPKGKDNVVYGDKVINLRNTKWQNWQKIIPLQLKGTALNYIANGEIGVITGEFRGSQSNVKTEPNIDITFSTQPGYSYQFKPSQLGEDGDYSIELAYCISVHKSQGSGFKKVFFILPSGNSLLSRELLYTALTRQVEQIIILHQGDFRDFLRFASDQYSETARRFTDLFDLPKLKELNRKRFDSRYVNISERGEPMISKNEVIIANCLLKYEREGLLIYSYEDKLKLKNDVILTPDFRIQHMLTGRIFYWEHLGMMTLSSYRKNWDKKLQAYSDDGFVLHTEANGHEEKMLIITEENPSGGIDSQYFDRLIKEIILEE